MANSQEQIDAAQHEPYGYVSTHINGQMHFNKTFHGVYRDTATGVVAVYTSQTAQRKPLTNEEIQEVVKKAVRERKLSWLGFKKDDQGEYTIPVLSPSDYQMVRAIEAAHGIKTGGAV